MFACEARFLKPGDEFTIDDGEVWHTCDLVVCNATWRACKVWCVGTDEPLFLGFDALVIVR